MKTLKIILVAVMSWLLATWPALANLTVTVHPGYTLAPDETPTTDTLNLLGEPTIEVTGTLDGSASLAAGSVNGTLLADTVVDGTTTEFNASVPRAIHVIVVGLVDGRGGIIASNSFLRIYIDPAYFRMATNSASGTNVNNGSTVTNWLTVVPESLKDTNISPTAAIQLSKLTTAIGTNAPSTNTLLVAGPDGIITNAQFSYNFQLAQLPNTNNSSTNLTLALRYFQSSLLDLPSGGGVVTSNLAHNLTLTNARPRVLRWVLVCVTNNAGYVVGDEIGLDAVRDGAGAAPFSYGASSTNVFLAKRASITSVLNKITAAGDGSFTEINWKARCYAAP